MHQLPLHLHYLLKALSLLRTRSSPRPPKIQCPSRQGRKEDLCAPLEEVAALPKEACCRRRLPKGSPPRLPVKPGVLNRPLLVPTFCCGRPGPDTALATCVPEPLAPANCGPEPTRLTMLGEGPRQHMHSVATQNNRGFTKSGVQFPAFAANDAQSHQDNLAIEEKSNCSA